jgi:hypothetical protein
MAQKFGGYTHSCVAPTVGTDETEMFVPWLQPVYWLYVERIQVILT